MDPRERVLLSLNHLEPDRVHLDEWEGFQKEKGMMCELPSLLKEPEPEMTLSLLRELRPGMTGVIGDTMLGMMDARLGRAGTAAGKKTDDKRRKRRGKRGRR